MCLPGDNGKFQVLLWAPNGARYILAADERLEGVLRKMTELYVQALLNRGEFILGNTKFTLSGEVHHED